MAGVARDSHHDDESLMIHTCPRFSLPGWRLRMALGTSCYIRPRTITYGNSARISFCDKAGHVTQNNTTRILYVKKVVGIQTRSYHAVVTKIHIHHTLTSELWENDCHMP